MATTVSNRAALESINHLMAVDRLPISIVLMVTSVVGVSSNIIIVFVYMSRMPNWRASGRFFVPFLAINDAIVCITGPVFRVYLNFNFIVRKSDVICQSGAYFINVFVAVSSMILLLITIDRFLFVYYSGSKPFALKFKWMSLIGILLIAFISQTPIWIFIGELEVKSVEHRKHSLGNMSFYQCSEIHGDKYEKSAIIHTALRIGFVFCQVIIMAVLYSLIARVIYRGLTRIRKTRTTPSNSSSKLSPDPDSRSAESDTYTPPKKEMSKTRERLNTMLKKTVSRQNLYGHFSRHRFTYTFMLLTGIYAINLIPSTVITLLSMVLGEHTFWYRLTYAELSVSLLAYNSDIIDSAIHPFIYGLLDTKLRSEIKRILKCWK